MTSMNPGLIIILIVVLILLVCYLLRNRLHLIPLFQNNPRQKDLNSHLIEAYESGSIVHLDAVQADETSPVNASSLIALEAAEMLSHRFSAADQSPMVTGNSPLVHTIMRDVAAEGFRKAGLENEFEPEKIEFAGFDSHLHQAVALSVLEDETMPLHVNVGTIGAEIALQDMMFRGEEAILLAGDDLTGQAVGMVVADDLSIGEELFELPARLQVKQNEYRIEPALLAMDVLRWVFLAALAAGAVMILLV